MTPSNQPVSAASATPQSGAEKKKPQVWQQEISKFYRQEVQVTYMLGQQLRVLVGRLVAYHPEGHHCVVDVADGCFFVRYPLEIMRRRRHGSEAAREYIPAPAPVKGASDEAAEAASTL